MSVLSKEGFEASVRFIQSQGRPLEKARCMYAFGGGKPQAVLDALARYQNEDGGFGHALEPDLRAPESSALCTTIAFQVLRELRYPVDKEIVLRGLEYFVGSFDKARQSWRIIPQAAEKSPRAPWWYQAERMMAMEEFSLNPTAEILGYLFDCEQKVPNELIAATTDRVLFELESIDEIDMHNLLCCLRLLKTVSLPIDYRQKVEDRIRQLIVGTVARDPVAWKGYSLRPLQVVDTPESPFIAVLGNAVAANLDYEISTQNTDGSWTPTWSWDDVYPAEWEKAKREWSGIITLEKLLTLKKFDRIKGIA